MGLFDWLKKGSTSDKSSEQLNNKIKKLESIIDNHDFNHEIKSLGPDNFDHFGSFYRVSDGISISGHTLQKLYQDELWVYSAINAISTTVGSIPWRTVQKSTNEDGSIEYNANEDNDLNSLLQFPNQNQSKTEFLNLLIIDLCTTGDAFIWLDGISGSKQYRVPDSMFRLNPSNMRIVPSSKDGEMLVDKYLLDSEMGSFSFDPKEIIHLKLPNPGSPFSGLSPLFPAFKRVLLDQFMVDHQLRFYKNGARIGGVIKSSKHLTKQQISLLQRSMESNYTGVKNQHRTLILPDGMDYSPIQASNVESQLLDFMKFNRDSIISAFKVPPIKLGFLEQASFANAKTQEKFYFTDTIVPMLNLIEDSLNLHPFVAPPDDSLRVDFDISNVAALQEDLKEKAEAAKLMAESGLTTDEVREIVWNRGPLAEQFDAAEKPLLIAKVEQIEKNTEDASMNMMPEETEEPQEKQLPSGDIDYISRNMIDTSQSLSDRIAELVSIFITQGVPADQAAKRALAQALQEGYKLEAPETREEELSESANMTEENQIPENTPEKNLEDLAEEQVAEEVIEEENLKQSMTGVTTTGGNNPPHTHSYILDEHTKSGHTVATSDGDAHIHEIVDGKVLPGEDGHIHAIPMDTMDESSHHDDEQKVERLPEESLNECVSRAVPKLMEEGMERDQAVAVAFSQCSKCQLPEEFKELSYKEYYDLGELEKKTYRAEVYKNFVRRTDPFIDERKKELDIFFEKYEALIKKRIGQDIKKYGLVREFKNDDVDRILNSKDLERLISKFIEESSNSIKTAFESGFNNVSPNLSLEFKLTPEIINELVTDLTLRQVGLYDDTTRKQLQRVMSEGFSKGRTISEISRDISNKFQEISAGRANTIARTEIMSAHSAGQQKKVAEIEKQFPEKQVREEWVTMRDNRVRDGSANLANHVKLDGTSIVKGRDVFNDGASDLRFPRDPKGAAESVVNCRCTLLVFLEDKTL